MIGLTEEQRARIAENRAKALQRLEERKKRLATEESHIITGIQKNTSKVLSVQIHNKGSGLNFFPKAPPNKRVINEMPNVKTFEENNFDSNANVTRPYIPVVKVNFIIMNVEYVKVVFSPFHIRIVDIIKEMKTRFYNEKEKFWTFKFCDYANFVTRLNSIKDIRVDIEELHPNVKMVFRDEFCGRKLDSKPVSLNGIDDNIVESLFSYQKRGVMFGIEKGGRVLIADEMGLGKSIQALALAQKYSAEWPLLIICPSSVKHSWRNQIERFLPKYTSIFTIDKSSDVLPKSRSTSVIVIMSYDQMSIRLKELLELTFYVIIFDESHFLKELKAKRTKSALNLSKKATRLILLSGTPALSRPIELFSQLKIINPRIFPDYQAFGIRYCNGRQGRFGYEMKGATNTDELAAILQKTVMIRRLKKDVLDDLPAKRREIIYLSGNSINHSMKRLRNAQEALLKSSNSKERHETLMQYYVETGIVKAQSVSEHIIENFFYEGAEPRKLIIFAHHSIVLDTLQMMLQRKNVKFIRIDGGTNQRDRGRLCDEFQTKEDVLVAILSITAAGIGITLTAASTVIFAELHWNPGCMLQAEDRAHRVGQKNAVVVQYMLARNTADDDIFPLIEKKLKMLGSVNLSSDSYKDAKNFQRDCSERAITNYFDILNNENKGDNIIISDIENKSNQELIHTLSDDDDDEILKLLTNKDNELENSKTQIKNNSNLNVGFDNDDDELFF